MVGKKYTKADIIDSIYEKTGSDRKEIQSIVELFLDDIKAALVDRKVIEIRGFGTFEIRIRKGRQKARNPRTGESLSVNSHGVAFFRAGRDLRKDVWNPKQDDEA
ncbi:MAG: integration host factor subunit beta [Treponema sp.]|jgi:integration host factor subunit beta|nr:integration host factor subunit beta [Treponema sp.]